MYLKNQPKQSNQPKPENIGSNPSLPPPSRLKRDLHLIIIITTGPNDSSFPSSKNVKHIHNEEPKHETGKTVCAITFQYTQTHMKGQIEL